MTQHNANLQRDKNELLEFVANSKLNARKKAQMTKALLEIFAYEEGRRACERGLWQKALLKIFECEEGLDDKLLVLKGAMSDWAEFELEVEEMLVDTCFDKERKAIEKRTAQREREFEELKNPSKKDKMQNLSELKKDIVAMSELNSRYGARIISAEKRRLQIFKEKVERTRAKFGDKVRLKASFLSANSKGVKK